MAPLHSVRLDATRERRIAEVRAEVRTELRDMRAELIKWMFLFVAGGTVTVLGVLFAIVQNLQR